MEKAGRDGARARSWSVWLVTVGIGLAAGCALLDSGPSVPGGAPAQTVDFGTPEGVQVSSDGLREAVVTWAPPTVKAYRYRIERSPAADGPFVMVAEVPPKALSYADGADPSSRLEDATAYHYRVIAVLERNGPVSPPSAVVRSVTAPPPVPPEAIRAEATGSRAVTVTWQASGSIGVTGYRVERAPVDEPTAFAPVSGEVSTLTFTDGGKPSSTLKDSSEYLYRVLTVNRAGSSSAPSATARVKTLPRPAQVKGLKAVSREVRCVPLKWTPSPEADVTHYTVFRARSSEGPFEQIGTAQGRAGAEYTDGGANPGNLEDEGTYFYFVRAVNVVTAESIDSDTVRAVTREVPPEVKQVAAVSARPREVPVEWEASPDTAVVGYEVWRTLAGADDWTQVGRVNSRETTRFLDRGGEQDATRLGKLQDGTEYQYRVVAFNTATVRSSASVPAPAKTKVIPVPPSGLVATTNLPHAIRLTWSPNPEPDVDGYRLEASKKPDGGFRRWMEFRLNEKTDLSAEEKELDPSQVRYYRVMALDREGLESLWSEPIEGRAKPLPDPPFDLQAETEGALRRITWQPPPQPDVVRYVVWEKWFLGWKRLADTDRPEFTLTLPPDQKPPTLAVSAVDQDGLESRRSEAVNP
ncbi:MAG TPA: fibronectin type III domain-containing protein [Kiritimatiellia bacterium]|nr:fibronectin type III domain-containing protein [Kiritimatiellia bacterium]